MTPQTYSAQAISHKRHAQHKKAYKTQPIPRVPLVLTAVAIISFVLLRYGLGFGAASMALLVVAAFLVYVTTLVHIQLGIAIMITAAALSPKVPLAFITLTLEDFIIPVVFFAWITRVIEYKEDFKMTNLKTPIFLYILLTGLATMLAALIQPNFNAVIATKHFVKYLEYFVIFIVTLNNIHSFREARAMIYTIIVVSGFVAISSIYAHLLAGASTNRVIGLGEYANPNIYGAYYGFMIMIIISVFFSARSLFFRILLIALLMLLSYPVIYSLSRTTWIMIGIGIPIIGIFMKDVRIIALPIVLLLALALFVPDFVKDRFTSITNAMQGTVSDNSLMHRMQTWEGKLPGIQENFLLGTGKGSVMLGNIDNEFLLQLIEAGILGLGLFLFIIKRIIQQSYQLSKTLKDRVLKYFCLGFLVATISMLIHSYAATTFTTVRTASLFWFCTGIVYAINAIQEENKQHENLFSKGFVDLDS